MQEEDLKDKGGSGGLIVSHRVSMIPWRLLDVCGRSRVSREERKEGCYQCQKKTLEKAESERRSWAMYFAPHFHRMVLV